MEPYKSENRMIRRVIHLFFPTKCPFCGKLIPWEELLCSQCKKTLPYCDKIRMGADFEQCAAPLYYEGDVRRSILRYKFYGKMSGLDCFGHLMAECAAEKFSGEFDAVTWVPVSHRRLKKRSYDQAKLLAERIGAEWGVSPQKTLKKTRNNPAQSGLRDVSARRANVLGVYQALDQENIAGKRFLLVDDILTTGATLGEAARILKEAGAKDVKCLTLAMTR